MIERTTGRRRNLEDHCLLALGYDPNATAEARTMRLRGYGNAICAPVAEAFIRAFLDVSA